MSEITVKNFVGLDDRCCEAVGATPRGEPILSIGERIRQLRLQKGLSQGDIEKVSGLLRNYVSRVEHGHTVPSLETLHRLAAALDLPLYRLFYTPGEESSTASNVALGKGKCLEELAEDTGSTGSEARFLLTLKGYVERMAEPDRAFLLDVAKRLVAK